MGLAEFQCCQLNVYIGSSDRLFVVWVVYWVLLAFIDDRLNCIWGRLMLMCCRLVIWGWSPFVLFSVCFNNWSGDVQCLVG